MGTLRKLGLLLIALTLSLPALAGVPPIPPPPPLPPVVNGNCLVGSGGLAQWLACSGSSSGVASVSGDGALISNSLSAGAVTLTLGTTTANKFWMGPTSGGAATPTYRLMVAADIPSALITYAKLQNGAAAGLLQINSGGAPTGIDLSGGGTQCLHASNSGIVTGTGSDCGTGGGGVTTFNTRSGAVTLVSGDVSSAGGLLASNNLNDVANLASSRVNMGIDQRSAHGSANVTLAVTDHYVTVCNKSDSACSTSTWGAPATWTFPTSGSVNDGDTIVIADDPAVVGNTNTLSIAPGAGDTINNAAAAAPTVLSAPGQKLTCQLDVTNKNWVCVASINNATAGQFLIAQGASASPAFLTLGGDISAVTSLGSVTVGTVKNVTYPGQTISTHSTLITTSLNTFVAKALVDCTDVSGNHINYAFSSDTWSCGSSANVANPSGILPIANGGTGVSLSATGGTHSFLKQASTGANVTVVVPVCADLSDSAASCATDATNAGNISSGTLVVSHGGTGLTSGTSGGVLAFTGSGTIGSSGALTANLPVIGGGAGVAPGVGTVTGNTTKFATFTGAATAAKCIDTDASGNLQVTAADCGTGSGSGTPATGNTTAVTVNTSTTSLQNLQELHPADGAFNTANMELNLHESGIFSTLTTAAITIEADLCTQTGHGGTCIALATIVGQPTTAASNSQFFVDVRCGVKTTGATGNLICHAPDFVDLTSGVTTATAYLDNATAVSSNFDLTGPNFIIFRASFSSPSASNTVTAQNAYVGAVGFGGTVTSIATTGPITGGTISGTGTIACATCVTSGASLTSGQLMTGAGSQASQTNSDATFASGALTLGTASSELGSVILKNATSTGNTTLDTSNVGASNFTMHLPAANDTIVGKATTDTLTNKSIAASQLTSTVAVANGGTASTTGSGAATALSHEYVLCQDTTQHAHTGDTTDTKLVSCTVPANLMGANGALRISFLGSKVTTSSNSATWTVRFGPNNSTADGALCNINSTASTTLQNGINPYLMLSNRNATNAQILPSTATNCTVINSTSSANVAQTFAIDTTAQTFVTVSGQLITSSADTIRAEIFRVEYIPIGGN